MSSKTVGVISPFSTSSSSMAEGLEKSGSPLLQQAVDNYRRQCGTVGDLKDYQQLSLDGLLEDTARLEQRARYSIHTRPSGIATRLQGLITFVDRYAPAMDCLVQTCSGSLINPAALVWGLLRILLEVSHFMDLAVTSLLTAIDPRLRPPLVAISQTCWRCWMNSIVRCQYTIPMRKSSFSIPSFNTHLSRYIAILFPYWIRHAESLLKEVNGNCYCGA